MRDPWGVKCRGEIGVNILMWGSDFAHATGNWPHSQDVIDETFTGVSEEERYAMLAGNAIEFFRLDAAVDLEREPGAPHGRHRHGSVGGELAPFDFAPLRSGRRAGTCGEPRVGRWPTMAYSVGMIDTPLSVLDLSPIVEGGDARQSLLNTIDLARHADAWGYTRYWLAEHHNMAGIASAATAVVIGQVAQATATIRVGAGGVMLANHAPLVIAEQFGTLAALFSGRIELGVGRAPGTDRYTERALRRTLNNNIDDFPQDVLELQHYFKEPAPDQFVRAVPGAGLNVPIWILGSSLYGAQLAAALGLPYAFASHFAPAALMQAIAVYRQRFEPSAQLDKPYVMVGMTVVAADTEEEAHFLRTSIQQSFVNRRRGMRGTLPPPVADFEDQVTPQERAMMEEAMSCTAVGAPGMVERQIAAFVERTGADEVMITANIHDHAKRLRSFELVAGLMGSASELRRSAAR